MTVKNKRIKNKKVNKMTLKELNNVLYRLQAVNDTSCYRKHIEDHINVTVSAAVNYAWPYYHKLSL